jgi:hypothetical protein
LPLAPDLPLRPARQAISQRALRPKQHDQLLALIQPPLLPGGDLYFRRYVNLIFAQAVESSIAFGEVSPRDTLRAEVGNAQERLTASDLDPALPTTVREAVDALGHESLAPDAQAAAASAVEVELSPVLLEVVEIVLHEEIPPEVRADGSFTSWLRSLEPERRQDVLRQALQRVEVEVKRGPSNTIDRRMVRGLAALVLEVAGLIPTRVYRAATHASRAGAGSRTGEVYWFLDLATQLASFVNDALPPTLRRPGVAALTGIVAEELKLLREEYASTAKPFAAPGDAPPD